MYLLNSIKCICLKVSSVFVYKYRVNLLTNIFGNLGLESFPKGFSFSRQPSGVEKDHFKFNQPKTNPDFTKRKSQNENNFLQKRLKNVVSDVDCIKNVKHMNQIYR